jgi:hypothetical protein
MTSEYLDRLARSDPLDLWESGELAEALVEIDDLVAARRQPVGEARVLSIRLAIYRRRLNTELSRRADLGPGAGPI